MAIMLAPFDASREFTAAAPFRCSGVLVSKDAPFDKALANDRLLRQLYEGRRIVYADQPAKDGRSTKRLRRLLSGLTESVRSHLASPPQISDPAEEATASPGTAEAAAAPVGEAGTAAADLRATKIDEMMIAHSQSALLEKAVAAEIEGVSKRTPKAELAAALVDAGHA